MIMQFVIFFFRLNLICICNLHSFGRIIQLMWRKIEFIQIIATFCVLVPASNSKKISKLAGQQQINIVKNVIFVNFFYFEM